MQIRIRIRIRIMGGILDPDPHRGCVIRIQKTQKVSKIEKLGKKMLPPPLPLQRQAAAKRQPNLFILFLTVQINFSFSSLNY